MRRNALQSAALLALSVWASGCAERAALVVPELPDGVHYGGLVFRGAGERWVGTGLARVEPPSFELDLVEPGDDYDLITLIALGEAEVRARTTLDDAALRDAPLLAPAAHRALLPTAFSASARRDGETIHLRADEVPLAVAAAWSGRCLSVLEDRPIPVEIRCSPRSCPTTVRQTGCELRFESPSCAYNTRGSANGLGELAVKLEGTVGDCRGGRSAEGEVRFQCTADLGPAGTRACELVAHERERPGPALELAHRRLGDPGTPPADPRRVRARGLAVEPGRLLTIHQPLGLPNSFDQCTNGPSELLELDLETLETQARWDLPPCAVDVASDPIGPRRWIVASGGTPALFRIALEGTVAASVPLPASAEGRTIVARRVHYDETTDTVTVMSGSPLESPELTRETFLDVFEAQSLTLRFSLALRGRNDDVWVPGPGRLGVYQTSTAPTSVSLDTGVLTKLATLPDDCPAVRERSTLSLPSGSLAVAGRGTLVLQSLDAASCDEFAFWEHERVPTALAAWPGDPQLLLVGLVREERQRTDTGATLAFFDLAERQFLWPSQAVGEGDLSTMRAHPNGTLYALGEQTGWVIRIRAAR